MEKYCIIAIFIWLGLPLLVRGLIFLKSDASLNIDRNSQKEEIPAVFDNRDDNRDYFSANQIIVVDQESTKSGFLNIDPNSQEDGIRTIFENRDEYRDYSSTNPVIASSHELIKNGSLNIEKKSSHEEDTITLSGLENSNDYHGYNLVSPINTNNHELNKSQNIHKISVIKEDGTGLPGIDNGIDYRDYPLENLIGAGDHEMVESGPLMEDIPDVIAEVYRMNKKRHIHDEGFTEERKKWMLDMHNSYRGNVTPPAADMNILEWDDNLATLAQLWSDNCNFAHGTPANTTYIFQGKIERYGQNLYIGGDPSGYEALYMWYEESMHYEMRNRTCKSNERCGHYVQMAWAKSKRLGCGIRKCEERHLITCHYFPRSFRDVQMFRIGRPCSLCQEEDGALCKDNLCVSHELCSRKPKICESATCNLKCHNCGQLNKTACKCTCADGWDALDCSKPCADEHKKCGKRYDMCPHRIIANEYCRKLCGTCTSVTNGTIVNHLCHEGSKCQNGFVLDSSCRCTLLCPEQLCGSMESKISDETSTINEDDESSTINEDGESSTLKYSFTYLILQILVLYYRNHFNGFTV